MSDANRTGITDREHDALEKVKGNKRKTEALEKKIVQRMAEKIVRKRLYEREQRARKESDGTS